MREFRNVLLLVALGGSIIFALQNTSPSLPLVFLGTKSLPLPLSVWILGAIAVGAIASWTISVFFRLYNYWGVQDSRPRRRRSRSSDTNGEPIPSGPSSWSSAQTNESDRRNYGNVPPYVSTEPVPPRDWGGTATRIQSNEEQNRPRREEPVNKAGENYASDPDEENWIDEDEDYIDESDVPTPEYEEDREFQASQVNYEVVQEPSSESWSGSMYSYSYKQRRESVNTEISSPYEGDYPIVTPPASPSPEPIREEREPEEIQPESLEQTPEARETPLDRQTPSRSADDWTTPSRKNEEWDW